MATRPPPTINLTTSRKKAGKRKSSRPSFSLFASPFNFTSSPPHRETSPPVSPKSYPGTSPANIPPPPPRRLGPQLSKWARTNLASSRWWIVAEPSEDELRQERRPKIQPLEERWEDKFEGRFDKQFDDERVEPEKKDEYTGMMDYHAVDPEGLEYKATMGMRF